MNDPSLFIASIASLETEKFRDLFSEKVTIAKIKEYLILNKYSNIKPGGEGMAFVAAEAMIPESSFEKYQDEYIKAMEKIPFSDRTYPTVSGNSQVAGYAYESMDMGNPRGWVLGLETNCCQHLGSVGGACVLYAAKNPDISGMLRIKKNGKTKAQSWFWFHQESGTFCFDNIEVAGGSGIDELGEDSAAKIMATYEAFIEQELVPRAALFGIKRVTVGLGYNELNIDKPVDTRPVTMSQMRGGSGVYSDAGRQKVLRVIS